MSVNELCWKFRNLAKDQKGQGLVEYALILVLIAVVVIAALTFVGNRTSNVISSVGTTLNK